MSLLRLPSLSGSPFCLSLCKLFLLLADSLLFHMGAKLRFDLRSCHPLDLLFPSSAFFFFLLPAELIILLVELYLYAGCGFLTGHSKGRAAAYAITANLASAVLGYYLAEPVWRLVVSIL